jgi:hypothetical protein
LILAPDIDYTPPIFSRPELAEKIFGSPCSIPDFEEIDEDLDDEANASEDDEDDGSEGPKLESDTEELGK